MSLSLSPELVHELSLSAAHAFSQSAWGRTHFPNDPPTTHCAGLTLFWLCEKMNDRSPWTKLDEPAAEVLSRIRDLQAASFYPSFPQDFVPTENERLLLFQKYGSMDWLDIRLKVEQEHQGDFVLYDLSRMFDYQAARITHVNDVSQPVLWTDDPQPQTAALGVLRYRENGAPSGHRIAWFTDQAGRFHFFDPNVGEVVCDSEATFRRWMSVFFLQTNYRKAEPETDPFLTIYELSGVSSH